MAACSPFYPFHRTAPEVEPLFLSLANGPSIVFQTPLRLRLPSYPLGISIHDYKYTSVVQTATGSEHRQELEEKTHRAALGERAKRD